MILYIDNTNTIELRGLKDSADDSAVTTATVTVTIEDANGDALTDLDGVSMPHVSAGLYRADIDPDIDLTGAKSAVVRAVIGEVEGLWRCGVRVVTRTC